jgi:hypothetical protein
LTFFKESLRIFIPEISKIQKWQTSSWPKLQFHSKKFSSLALKKEAVGVAQISAVAGDGT